MMPTKTDSLRHDIQQLMKSGSFHEIVDRCHLELTLARREKHYSIEIIALLGLAQAQCSLGHFDFARDYSATAIELAQQIRSTGLPGRWFAVAGSCCARGIFPDERGS